MINLLVLFSFLSNGAFALGLSCSDPSFLDEIKAFVYCKGAYRLTSCVGLGLAATGGATMATASGLVVAKLLKNGGEVKLGKNNKVNVDRIAKLGIKVGDSVVVRVGDKGEDIIRGKYRGSVGGKMVIMLADEFKESGQVAKDKFYNASGKILVQKLDDYDGITVRTSLIEHGVKAGDKIAVKSGVTDTPSVGRFAYEVDGKIHLDIIDKSGVADRIVKAPGVPEVVILEKAKFATDGKSSLSKTSHIFKSGVKTLPGGLAVGGLTGGAMGVAVTVGAEAVVGASKFGCGNAIMDYANVDGKCVPIFEVNKNVWKVLDGTKEERMKALEVPEVCDYYKRFHAIYARFDIPKRSDLVCGENIQFSARDREGKRFDMESKYNGGRLVSLKVGGPGVPSIQSGRNSETEQPYAFSFAEDGDEVKSIHAISDAKAGSHSQNTSSAEYGFSTPAIRAADQIFHSVKILARDAETCCKASAEMFRACEKRWGLIIKRTSVPRQMPSSGNQ